MVTEQNYFDLFGLSPAFEIDPATLGERYRELQKTFHPDRYAQQSEREQLRAVQASAHLNEALATLKSPLKRAAYLLRLKGVDTDASAATIADGAFLMQQMQLREQLEDAQSASDPFAALERLQSEVDATQSAMAAELARLLRSDAETELLQARDILRKLQFFDKLQHQIEQLEDELDSL